MADFAPSGVEFEGKNFAAFEKIIKSADKLMIKWEKTIVKTTESMNKLEKQSQTFDTKQTQRNRKLTTSATQMERYGRAIGTVGTELVDLRSDLASSQTGLDRMQQTQEQAADSTQRLSQNLRRLQSNTKTFNSTLKDSGVRDFSAATASASTSSRTFKDSLSGISQRLTSLSDKAKSATSEINSFVTSIGKKAALGAGAFALAAGVAGVAAVNTAASFESAFVGVGKTVDGLVVLGEDGFLQMTTAGETFRNSLEELTETTIPTSFEELAKIAELGGQLGFVSAIEDADEAQAALLSFTETIAGLSEATDLTSEAAAQNLSRFANIFSEDFTDPGANIANLGDIIVALGNDSATTESQIVSFATRMAGAAKTAGLTQGQVLGISAAFSSIGITAESGGTAVSRVLLDLQKVANTTEGGFVDNNEAIEENEKKLRDQIGALRTLEAQTGLSAQSILDQQDAFVAAGGSVAEFGEKLGDTRQRRLLGMIEDIQDLETATQQLVRTNGQSVQPRLLQKFLDVTGETREEFQRLAKEDPATLFTKLIEGISNEGDNASAALAELGFNSSEIQRALLGMSNNTDLLTDSLELATNEILHSGALADETEKRYATFESRLDRFKNTLRNTAADIGDVFLPALGSMLGGAGEIVDVFGDRTPEVFDALLAKAGELTGFDFGEFSLVDTVNAGFDSLIETIDTFDVTPIQTGIDLLNETVFPAFNDAVTLITDNWDIFEAALIGLGTAAGILVTISTLASIGAGIMALLTPVGLIITGVTALTVAWQTNLFGIQDITSTFVDTITTTLSGIQDAFNTDGLEGVFDFLQVPEGLRDNITQALEPFTDFALPESFNNLIDQVKDLFSGESFTALTTGAETVGTALLNASTAIAGFGITVGAAFAGNVLERITAMVDGLAAIIEVVDGLLDGDLEQVQTGLSNLVTAIAEFTFSPIEGIAGMIFGEDIDLVTPITDALAAAASTVTEFIWPLLPEVSFGDFVWPELPEFTVDPDLFAPLFVPFEDIDTTQLTVPLNDLITNITDLATGDSATKLQEFVTALISPITELTTFLTSADTLEFLGTAGTTLLEVGSTIAQFTAALAAAGLATMVENVGHLVSGVSAIIGVIDALLEAEDPTEHLNTLKDALIGFATAPFENITEVFTGEDIDFVTPVQNALNALTSLSLPEVPAFTFLAGMLDTSDVTIDFTTPIQNALNALSSLTLPELPDIVGIFTKARDDIVALFSGLNPFSEMDFSLPEFNILPEGGLDIIPDIEVPEILTDILPDFSTTEAEAKVAGQDIGTAINQGLAEGAEEDEGVLASIGSTAEDAWNSMTDWWESESPSERTRRLGQDISDGLALGIQENETIMPAIEQINSLAGEAFQNMSDTLLSSVLPGVEEFTFAMDNLHLLTLPSVTSQILDSLIPTKQALTSLNTSELTPSVRELDAAESEFSSTILSEVVPAISSQIAIMEAGVTQSKKLDTALKNLIKRYKALAAAIAEARRQGSGVPTGVSGNEPVGSGSAGAFAEGGSFTVPSTIPKEFQGPTGGMMIEVHPKELVNILPASIAGSPPESAPVAAPQFSGASMQSAINNTQVSNDNSQELHLHVNEAVSPSFRGNIGLLSALGKR